MPVHFGCWCWTWSRSRVSDILPTTSLHCQPYIFPQQSFCAILTVHSCVKHQPSSNFLIIQMVAMEHCIHTSNVQCEPNRSDICDFFIVPEAAVHFDSSTKCCCLLASTNGEFIRSGCCCCCFCIETISHNYHCIALRANSPSSIHHIHRGRFHTLPHTIRAGWMHLPLSHVTHA